MLAGELKLKKCWISNFKRKPIGIYRLLGERITFQILSVSFRNNSESLKGFPFTYLMLMVLVQGNGIKLMSVIVSSVLMND